MTASKHVYSAALIGAPDVPLHVLDGQITFDAGRAPHVTASITIAPPDLATLIALDPRLNPRVRITVDATFPTSTQNRTFNLELRRRQAAQNDALIALDLASDEQLLADYGPLADDRAPLTMQASLRQIVNYVIGTAIPGAALQPGADVPMRALSNASNLVPNPRAGVNLTDWTGLGGTLTRANGGPPGSPSLISLAATATSGLTIVYDRTKVSVTPGRAYRLSAFFIGTTGLPMTFDVVIYDAAGNIILDVPEQPGTPANAWERRSLVFVTPPNAHNAALRFFSTVAATSGQQINVSGVRLDEVGDDAVDDAAYFDGDTIDSAEYRYDWGGPAHASTATRRVLVDAPTPEALVWRAGQSALDFLAPLVQVVGYRLVCNELRAWTLRGEAYVAPGSLTIRYAVNMTEGTDEIDRDSGVWFDAAATRYTWDDFDGITQERTDTFAIKSPYNRLWLFEKTTPYPGPGFSAYAVRRAQGRGREVSATAVADWRANAEQPVQITLHEAAIQSGITQTVTFDLSTDEMTVTTRSIDTPAGAIDLLVGTIDALPGTIDAL